MNNGVPWFPIWRLTGLFLSNNVPCPFELMLLWDLNFPLTAIVRFRPTRAVLMPASLYALSRSLDHITPSMYSEVFQGSASSFYQNLTLKPSLERWTFEEPTLEAFAGSTMTSQGNHGPSTSHPWWVDEIGVRRKRTTSWLCTPATAISVSASRLATLE